MVQQRETQSGIWKRRQGCHKLEKSWLAKRQEGKGRQTSSKVWRSLWDHGKDKCSCLPSPNACIIWNAPGLEYRTSREISRTAQRIWGTTTRLNKSTKFWCLTGIWSRQNCSRMNAKGQERAQDPDLSFEVYQLRTRGWYMGNKAESKKRPRSTTWMGKVQDAPKEEVERDRIGGRWNAI